VFYDFTKATPGSINGAYSLLGKVEDTVFSVKRGFYTTSFPLAITTPHRWCQHPLYHGSLHPTETNGTIYSAPITIGSTTVVRAAAFKNGLSADQTWIRRLSFSRRTSSPSRRPVPRPRAGRSDRSMARFLDYGMDPAVVNSTRPGRRRLGGRAKLAQGHLLHFHRHRSGESD